MMTSVLSPSHIPTFQQAYDAEAFRVVAHRLVDQLADYLAHATLGANSALPMPVLPHIAPEPMMARWALNSVPHQGAGVDALVPLIQRVIQDSNHLHHPGYIGHQVSSPLPIAALCDMVDSLLNNGTAVYEMGPASNAMERTLLGWMAQLAGYPETAEGIFTSGGTLGNFTALLTARKIKAGYDIWTEGVHQDPAQETLAVMVSDENHYSVKRAIQLMGLGKAGIVSVPTDDQFHITAEALQMAYDEATRQGKKIFALVGNACSTATGAYDSLDVLADFAEAHDLWFHVDGAHGASVLLSQRYKKLAQGIERADSIVWDAHKMMMVPALITAVLYKNGDHPYQTFAQEARYIFQEDAREEWYNSGHRTFECTKKMLSLKLYAVLHCFGSDFLAQYIDRVHDLTRWFAKEIDQSPDFELGHAPQSNILCFRYVGTGPRPTAEALDDLQKKLRAQVLERENFYIVQTQLKTGFYLRVTVMNPLTTERDLMALLDELRSLAKG